MRNEVWSEMDRTCTKKSSENHFQDIIADRNYQNYGPQSWGCRLCWRMARIADRNSENYRPVIIRVGSADLNFKSDFSQGSKENWTLSSQVSLNTLKNWSQVKKKKKRRTPLKKILEKNNSRTGREIENLLGVFFHLLFSNVVLLFKH
jgi:hypothetical protein